VHKSLLRVPNDQGMPLTNEPSQQRRGTCGVAGGAALPPHFLPAASQRSGGQRSARLDLQGSESDGVLMLMHVAVAQPSAATGSRRACHGAAAHQGWPDF